MRQWEIYDFPQPSADDPHPCVVISPDRIAGNDQLRAVNVVACQTLYAGRTLKYAEVGLDEADGVERLTVAKCQYILFFDKNQAGRRRGMVKPERVLALKRKLGEMLPHSASY